MAHRVEPLLPARYSAERLETRPAPAARPRLAWSSAAQSGTKPCPVVLPPPPCCLVAPAERTAHQAWKERPEPYSEELTWTTALLAFAEPPWVRSAVRAVTMEHPESPAPLVARSEALTLNKATRAVAGTNLVPGRIPWGAESGNLAGAPGKKFVAAANILFGPFGITGAPPSNSGGNPGGIVFGSGRKVPPVAGPLRSPPRIPKETIIVQSPPSIVIRKRIC